MPPVTALDRALADLSPAWSYAIRQADALGWQVFPLLPGRKVPYGKCPDCAARTGASRPPRPGRPPVVWDGPTLTPAQCLADCAHPGCHGLLGATADVPALLRLARERPYANTAARTGRASNTLVLDSDGATGMATRKALREKYGAWPETRTHRTGGGTLHELFDYPDLPNPRRPDGRWCNSAGMLGAGLDIRADGGLIVLPGSRTPKGVYRELRAPEQMPPPGWLLGLLAPNPPAATPRPSVTVSTSPTATVLFGWSGRGVHPYVSTVLDRKIGEFAALVGIGNGRSDRLYKISFHLSGYVDAQPPTGLTEDALTDALAAACRSNGYATAHSTWSTTIANGVRDGRGKPPSNWPPPSRPMSSWIDPAGLAPVDAVDALVAVCDEQALPERLAVRVSELAAARTPGALIGAAREAVRDAAEGMYPGRAAVRAVAAAYGRSGGAHPEDITTILRAAIGADPTPEVAAA
ncbi:bifunctional DNA primase/polymerase [Pseudonocardia alni]|uniref:bifunctional DNA primase/polymerase n=1 Tax=Pseudonocardia alni TaxID=33907 RepID=UPI00331713B5